MKLDDIQVSSYLWERYETIQSGEFVDIYKFPLGTICHDKGYRNLAFSFDDQYQKQFHCRLYDKYYDERAKTKRYPWQDKSIDFDINEDLELLKWMLSELAKDFPSEFSND